MWWTIQIVGDVASRTLKLSTSCLQHHLYTLLSEVDDKLLFLSLRVVVALTPCYKALVSPSCAPSCHCLRSSLLWWCHLNTCKWSLSKNWPYSYEYIGSIIGGREQPGSVPVLGIFMEDCPCRLLSMGRKSRIQLQKVGAESRSLETNLFGNMILKAKF